MSYDDSLMHCKSCPLKICNRYFIKAVYFSRFFHATCNCSQFKFKRNIHLTLTLPLRQLPIVALAPPHNQHVLSSCGFSLTLREGRRIHKAGTWRLAHPCGSSVYAGSVFSCSKTFHHKSRNCVWVDLNWELAFVNWTFACIAYFSGLSSINLVAK